MDSIYNRLRSEDTEQMAVITWARWEESTYPELKLLFHVPNGGSRNKVEAAKFKKMGVRAGVPDLVLPVPKGIYSGLFIEMKYDKGRLQESQKEYLLRARLYENCCYVCYSAEDAIGVIKEYLNLEKYPPEDENDNGEKSIMKSGNGIIMRHGKAEIIR